MVFVVNTLNSKGKERYKHNAINMLKRSLNLVSFTLLFFFFSSHITINFQLQTRRKEKP